MGIIAWIVFGFLAGMLAKWIMPGDDPQGCVVTVILGIFGSMVGGFIGTALGFGKVDSFDFRSMAIAVLGTVIILALHRQMNKKSR